MKQLYKLCKYIFLGGGEVKLLGLIFLTKECLQWILQHMINSFSTEANLSSLKEKETLLFSTMYKLGIIESVKTDIPSILLMRNRERVFSNKDYRLINVTNVKL